ncbi:hypothetical protein SRHO_G00153810 [Serrasalmus rhombeus]
MSFLENLSSQLLQQELCEQMVLCWVCVEEKGSSHGQDGPAGTPAGALKSYLSRLGIVTGLSPVASLRRYGISVWSRPTGSLQLVYLNAVLCLCSSQSSSMKDTTVLQQLIHRAGAAHKAHYQHTPLQSPC